jgi:biofilm PGA synthesis N-glycosyltransferase PgaC
VSATATGLLVVSPVRNEAAHIERVVRAMAAQTRPPERWIVVDDASQDDTLARLRALEAEVPFMTVLSRPPAHLGPDRLARAAEVAAFHHGLASVRASDFGLIAKLDGDIELPPHYFATLLDALDAEPALGIAGGVLLEPTAAGGWKPARIPEYHVRGALKLYRRECLEAIGGLVERLGWDTIDETYARMLGWETRSLPSAVALHHRPAGTAEGQLRGRARLGLCAYILRYPAPWTFLRAFKVALERPRGFSGIAFLYGYARAAVARAPRVEDEAFLAFVRGELYGRMRRLAA